MRLFQSAVVVSLGLVACLLATALPSHATINSNDRPRPSSVRSDDRPRPERIRPERNRPERDRPERDRAEREGREQTDNSNGSDDWRIRPGPAPNVEFPDSAGTADNSGNTNPDSATQNLVPASLITKVDKLTLDDLRGKIQASPDEIFLNANHTFTLDLLTQMQTATKSAR
jgi:hypothetical protein